MSQTYRQKLIKRTTLTCFFRTNNCLPVLLRYCPYRCNMYIVRPVPSSLQVDLFRILFVTDCYHDINTDIEAVLRSIQMLYKRCGLPMPTAVKNHPDVHVNHEVL